MSRAIGVVLIGCGRMGQAHLRALRAEPTCRVVGMVDPLAGDLQRQGVVASFESIDWRQVDAAIIASPTTTHGAIARHLIERDIAVLVEKPLAATAAQAAQLVALAERRGVPLAVGHVERFNPAFRVLSARIGELGALRELAAVRVGSRGKPAANDNVLLDLAIHDIDLVRCLLGPLSCVSAQQYTVAGVADSANLLLESASGARVAIQVSWAARERRRQLVVDGADGAAQVDFLTRQISGAIAAPIERAAAQRDPLALQLAAFLELLRGTRSPTLCDGRSALIALQLVERLLAISAVSDRTACVGAAAAFAS